MLEYCYW